MAGSPQDVLPGGKSREIYPVKSQPLEKVDWRSLPGGRSDGKPPSEKEVVGPIRGPTFTRKSKVPCPAYTAYIYCDVSGELTQRPQ